MSLPPSSQVLQNFDLLNIIFGFLDISNSRKRHELLYASLTSKTFLEAALNILWYELPDVMQVCCLLPSFNKKTGEFIVVVRDQDLERALYYTRRIHYLVIDIEKVNKFPAINPDVLGSFFNRINKAAAFHSLRTLTIIYDQNATYRHQLLLFPISAPNLKEIRMNGDSEGLPEISVASFLYTISSESPNVTNLTIQSHVTWTKTIFDVLPCFRKLESLSIQDFGYDDPLDFLKNCASSMTSLRSLTIQLASFRLTDSVGRPMSTKKPSSLGLITFRTLSSLDLSGSFNDVENMLNILLVPRLVSTWICFESNNLHDEIVADIKPRLNRFLASNGRYLKDSLRLLSLKCPAQLPIEDYLNSFKVFTHLDRLHFECNGSYIPTMNFTHFFSGDIIWPNLTDLSLVNYHDTGRVGDILSIAVLPLIADAFPRLLSLRVTIYNPDRIVIKEIAATRVRKTHGLTRLIFDNDLPQEWDYSTSSAEAFASFLYQIFPKLKSVQCFGCSQWIKSVQKILKREMTREVGMDKGSC